MRFFRSGTFNVVAGVVLILLGGARIAAGTAGWSAYLAIVIGLFAVLGGLAERSAARTAAGTRASLTPGDRSVVLLDAGPRRIEVIRQLRGATGLDLASAKSFVDRPGSQPLTGVESQVAEAVASRLRQVGATVQVVPYEEPGDGR